MGVIVLDKVTVSLFKIKCFVHSSHSWKTWKYQGILNDSQKKKIIEIKL